MTKDRISTISAFRRDIDELPQTKPLFFEPSYPMKLLAALYDQIKSGYQNGALNLNLKDI
jgi:hypothetical protein